MPATTAKMTPNIRTAKSLHQAHSPTDLPDRSHHPRMMAMAIAATMAIIPMKKLLPRRGFAFGNSCWTLTTIIPVTPWPFASGTPTFRG